MRSPRIALGLALVASLMLPLIGLAQQATPTPGNIPLFTGILPADVLPTEAGPVYFVRATYLQGEGEDLVPDNGLTLMGVEIGTLTVTANGPATLLGADSPVPGENVPSGTAFELSAGAGMLIPSGTGAIVTNASATPVTTLYVALYPAEGFVPLTPESAEAPSGEVGNWTLIGKGSPQQPLSASVVTIERIAAAPGVDLGVMEEPGIAVIFIEEGSIQTTVEEGLVEASSAAFLRTGAVGPGAAFVGPGQERRVRAEGSLFVQPGTVMTVRNDGDDPATLLVVRLSPTEDAAGGTPVS